MILFIIRPMLIALRTVKNLKLTDVA